MINHRTASPTFAAHEFRKATRSNTDQECVEVARRDGWVELRDDKKTFGATDDLRLRLTEAQFDTYQTGARAGDPTGHGLETTHRADGTWLFKDRELTCFTNEEETQATFAGNAPWLLEDRLRLAGAKVITEPAWTPHFVEDGNLITGQQNVSSGVAADAVLRKLKVLA